MVLSNETGKKHVTKPKIPIHDKNTQQLRNKELQLKKHYLPKCTANIILNDR